MFSTELNKFKKIYKLANDNNNTLNKLENVQTKTLITNFNKEYNQIILADHELFTSFVYETSYQFDNVTENDLNYFKPFAFLSTTEGYQANDTWEFSAYFWWKVFENTITLKCRTDGYLTGVGGSSVAPRYLTLKIHVLNKQLFQQLIHY